MTPEEINLNDLRACLRGSLSREDKKGMILVPAHYIKRALAALPASVDEPQGFTWTPEMYEAFDALRADKNRYPFMDKLIMLWRAINGAAQYDD